MYDQFHRNPAKNTATKNKPMTTRMSAPKSIALTINTAIMRQVTTSIVSLFIQLIIMLKIICTHLSLLCMIVFSSLNHFSSLEVDVCGLKILCITLATFIMFI
uniref:Uncharacterized protein n=1 Tax=Cacopsylla melanoneura TaxID=428564 RepID=A0A8D8ZK02_9HEMI